MPADTTTQTDPALSGQIKKRIAIAAGLALVALAAIPLINNTSNKAPDSTPASQPVSSGKIVQKEASPSGFVVEAPVTTASAPASQASAPLGGSPLAPSPASPLAVMGKPAAPVAPSTSLASAATPAATQQGAGTNKAMPAVTAPAPSAATTGSSSAARPATSKTPPPGASAAPAPAGTAVRPNTPPPPAAPAPAGTGKPPTMAPGHITLPGDEAAATPARTPPRAANNQTAPAGSSFGYQVQLGLFATPENADRLIDDLKKRGIAARSETRVQLGPFRTRAEAEEAMNKLKALGYQPLLIPAGS